VTAGRVIDPGATIGTVHLTVRDLAGGLAFYRDRLGFEDLGRGSGGSARLGAGGVERLVLHGDPQAPRVRGTTGLYHFAILVPSRPDLARSLAHLLETRTALAGASDHLVSEALYLSDPEGNGIEIYRDRPRDEWAWERGAIRLASDPLDLDGLLAEPAAREAWTGLAPETRIGHVHLRVSRIDEAESFYVGVLGFERTARLGDSALFVAAGGYHHHLGLNTWGGAGAPAPPSGAAGLREFVIELPDAKGRDRLADSIRKAGVDIRHEGDAFRLRDPFSNGIVLRARAERREPARA